MNKFFLYLFYFFSYLFDIFENFYNNITRNKHFKEYSLVIYEYYNKIYIFINSLEREPKTPYIQISYFNRPNQITNELLLSSDNFNNINNNINSYFIQTISRKKHLNYKKILFTTKYISYNKEYTISKLINDSNLGLGDFKINYVNHSELSDKAKNPFLALEYSHKMMKNIISIDLDKNHFVNGNDILDNLFVLKYLKKKCNKKDYIFDKDYTITIIDESAKIYSLFFDQYIHIDNNDWKIIKN